MSPLPLTSDRGSEKGCKKADDRATLSRISHLPKESKPGCLQIFWDQSHCKPWNQLVSTSVATTSEVSKTGLHKKIRKSKFIHILQTTSVTIQNWLQFTSLGHWLLSDLTALTGKNTARHIFYKILQAGCFCMYQFYMCKLPWMWSTNVCTRHIYTCMKEKVISWKRGLPRNREKSKQV